ncbi:MAG: hypothetical protein Q9165_007972 [Trypethelium subeluteriae]
MHDEVPLDKKGGDVTATRARKFMIEEWEEKRGLWAIVMSPKLPPDGARTIHREEAFEDLTTRLQVFEILKECFQAWDQAGHAFQVLQQDAPFSTIDDLGKDLL